MATLSAGVLMKLLDGMKARTAKLVSEHRRTVLQVRTSCRRTWTRWTCSPSTSASTSRSRTPTTTSTPCCRRPRPTSSSPTSSASAGSCTSTASTRAPPSLSSSAPGPSPTATRSTSARPSMPRSPPRPGGAPPPNKIPKSPFPPEGLPWKGSTRKRVTTRTPCPTTVTAPRTRLTFPFFYY